MSARSERNRHRVKEGAYFEVMLGRRERYETVALGVVACSFTRVAPSLREPVCVESSGGAGLASDRLDPVIGWMQAD